MTTGQPYLIGIRCTSAADLGHLQIRPQVDVVWADRAKLIRSSLSTQGFPPFHQTRPWSIAVIAPPPPLLSFNLRPLQLCGILLRSVSLGPQCTTVRRTTVRRRLEGQIVNLVGVLPAFPPEAPPPTGLSLSLALSSLIESGVVAAAWFAVVDAAKSPADDGSRTPATRPLRGPGGFSDSALARNPTSSLRGRTRVSRHQPLYHNTGLQTRRF